MKAIPKEELAFIIERSESDLVTEDDIKNVFACLGDTYYLSEDNHSKWELCEVSERRKEILEYLKGEKSNK